MITRSRTDKTIISADTSMAKPQSKPNRIGRSAPIPISIRPFVHISKIRIATMPTTRRNVSQRAKRPSRSDAKAAKAISNSLKPTSHFQRQVGRGNTVHKSPRSRLAARPHRLARTPGGPRPAKLGPKTLEMLASSHRLGTLSLGALQARCSRKSKVPKALALARALHYHRRRTGGRVVEGTALEMRRTCKRTVGSNPTLSASGQRPPKTSEIVP